MIINKRYSHLDILEDSLKVQPMLSTIQLFGWFLLYTACCFYTLFLFDILGDSVGFYKAYWVLIVMPGFPLCIHVLVAMKEEGHHKNSNFIQDGIQLSAPIVGVVQNPLVQPTLKERRSPLLILTSLIELETPSSRSSFID